MATVGLLCAGIFAASSWFCVVVAQNGDSGRDASDRLYCPVGQTGYFADPTNCTRYAKCVNGRLTSLHRCPSNRHWRVTNLGYGYCDLPESAGCQLQGVPDPIDGLEPLFVCPRTLLCNRMSVDGQYGDPFNCSRFYLCIDGQSFVSDCPAGMSWSERAGHCDWSQRAHCDLRLLQRYGLECVSDTTTAKLTTDAMQSNDSHTMMMMMTNTTTDCAMDDCFTTSNFTSSSNLTSSTSEASGIAFSVAALCVLRWLT